MDYRQEDMFEDFILIKPYLIMLNKEYKFLKFS